MNAFAALQRAFAASLHEEDDAAIAAHVRPGTVCVAARLGLYRRNMRASLHDALAATYPVVRRLVGDAFFREMALRYAARAPSRSGDLREFGGALDRFLAEYAPASELAYLPDVARLEWACNECFHAADAQSLDAGELARVPADRQGAIRLRLHPAVRLVESIHPVVAIWEANQTARDGTPARSEGAERALVWREDFAVRVRTAERAEWSLACSLRAGASLEEAAAAMGGDDAERFLATALVRLAADGALAGFALAEEPA